MLGHGHKSHAMKIHNFFQNPLYSWANISQTEHTVYTCNNELGGGVYKNINFMTSRVRGGFMYNIDDLYQYAIVLKDFSSAIV